MDLSISTLTIHINSLIKCLRPTKRYLRRTLLSQGNISVVLRVENQYDTSLVIFKLNKKFIRLNRYPKTPLDYFASSLSAPD
jgi:hypothetical protein